MAERGTASEPMRSAALAGVTADGMSAREWRAASAGSPLSLAEQADDVLISLFQSGEERAFRVLVERYQERVRNLLFAMFREREVAEDIAQEVFIRVYESLPQFRFESSFFTWLYRVTVNKGRDELRRRKVRRWLSFHSLSDQPEGVIERAAPVHPVDTETQDLVARALAQIPAHFRVAVILKDMEGMSYEEIAGVLQCRVGTVKSRLARGRSLLRSVLKPLLEEA